MDRIKELTYKKNALAEDKGNRIASFLVMANQDVRDINNLIVQYNIKRNNPDKQALLNEIDIKRQLISNKYPASFLAQMSDFSEQIEHKLFNQIKIERTTLGIHSKHADNSLPFIIENMSSEKITRLMEILNKGSLFQTAEFNDLYSSTDPVDDYENFQAFLDSITEIKLIESGNSKNFKVTYPNGNSLVLKLEHRLDQPALIEDELQSGVLKDVLTPIHMKRQGTFTYDGTHKKRPTESRHTISRTLVVTDFCHGGDLEYHGAKQKTINEKIDSAVNIYTQMASILTKLTQKNYAFPDMKNSNWLLDDNQQLKIADTKSFIYINDKGNLDNSLPRNTWCGLIQSDFISPPEIMVHFDNDVYSADKMHAYMFGKNLYQYLTGCSCNKLNQQLLYGASVFTTHEGKQLKDLIKSMVHPLPNNRVSIDYALQQLNTIRAGLAQKAAQALKANVNAEKALKAAEALELAQQNERNDCKLVLKQIPACRFGKNDTLMDEFVSNKQQEITSANNLTALKSIHKELDSILTMNKSDSLTVLNEYLVSLRRSPLYYFDKSNKYRQIKEAIMAVPIEERGNINKTGIERGDAIIHLQTVLHACCDPKWLAIYYTPQGQNKTAHASRQYKQQINEQAVEDKNAFNPMIKK